MIRSPSVPANATGSFGTDNVGSELTVTIAGLTVSGAQVGDYFLTETTATASITAAPLTVTGVTAANKVYNASRTATVDTAGATLAGVYSGDTVNLNTLALPAVSPPITWGPGSR